MNVRGDRELLEAKADLAEQHFRELDAIQAEGIEAFRKSMRSYLAANFALMASIEAALDVASHLIAENGWRRPSTYAEAFTVLCEEGLLGEDLRDRLAAMARFRNLLVHQYAAVSRERVWTILQGDRHDVRRFLSLALDAVGRAGREGQR